LHASQLATANESNGLNSFNFFSSPQSWHRFCRALSSRILDLASSRLMEEKMMASAPQLAITLPDGSVANFEEIQAYGQVLQRFILEQEAALPAVKDANRHNEIIDYLRLLARSYNAQLRRFKAAQAQRQKAILVVLIRTGPDGLT